MNTAATIVKSLHDNGPALNAADMPVSEELHLMDRYWRAANYLSVGQIYLYDNPMLREPLKLEHVKPLVVGHWGTTPGQNFIYVHLNRVIKKHDLDMFYIAGPGHGGPALVANTYLEGSYSEIYPNISRDEEGMKKLFTQFSFPGGISSHVAPTTPGSIHEGGELGYSLSHAFGAAFDNPGLIVACIIGDGEAETGPLATAWQSNKLLDPITDGAVLPILHLNGFKISNPTILSRIEPQELEQFLRGCGWTPYFVEGDDPATMHRLMAETLDHAIEDIQQIQRDARSAGKPSRPRWPVIVLRSPKGWTGPKMIDGLKIEGTFRAHQVPILVDPAHPGHVANLEAWMRSYKAEELFDARGRLMPELAALAPAGDRRMGANPHANGGLLLHDLRMPDFRDHAVAVPSPGAVTAQDTMVLGKFLRDVVALNQETRNFRIFGPDETLSNLLGAVFEVTDRQWDAREVADDEFLAPAGRVVDSMLAVQQLMAGFGFAALQGRRRAPDEASGDLSGLLLATLIGLTYLEFMSYLVVWYGDRPPLDAWYIPRASPAWRGLVWISLTSGIAALCCLALRRRIGAHRAVAWAGGAALLGLLSYQTWLLAPAFGGACLGPAGLALLAMGGIWLALAGGAPRLTLKLKMGALAHGR